MISQDDGVWVESPVHAWFELSYAQFLTVPRVIMQAMPHDWQERMVALLEELDETFDWRPAKGRFWVQLRNDRGEYASLPNELCNYRRGSVEHLRKKQHCHAGRDGDCEWSGCPQARDGEPERTNRHCPLDRYVGKDEEEALDGRMA